MPFSIEGSKYNSGNKEVTVRQGFHRITRRTKATPSSIVYSLDSHVYSYSNGVLCTRLVYESKGNVYERISCPYKFYVVNIYDGWERIVQVDNDAVPLHFASGVMSYRHGRDIIAISVSKDSEPVHLGSLQILPRLDFVRNNSDHLLAGMYYVDDEDGYGHWKVRCLGLKPWKPRHILDLPNIIGKRMNVDVDFKIYGKYFYAATTQQGIRDDPTPVHVEFYRYLLEGPLEDLESGHHARPHDIEQSLGYFSIQRKEDGRVCIIESAVSTSKSRKSYEWDFDFSTVSDPRTTDFDLDGNNERPVRCYDDEQGVVDLVQSIDSGMLRLRTSGAGSKWFYHDLFPFRLSDPLRHFYFDVDGQCAILWITGKRKYLVVVFFDSKAYCPKAYQGLPWTHTKVSVGQVALCLDEKTTNELCKYTLPAAAQRGLLIYSTVEINYFAEHSEKSLRPWLYTLIFIGMNDFQKLANDMSQIVGTCIPPHLPPFFPTYAFIYDGVIPKMVDLSREPSPGVSIVYLGNHSRTPPPGGV